MLSSKELSVIREQAYCGYPSQLKGVCNVYPSMMRDYLKNTIQFSGRLGILLLTETEISDLIKKKTGKEIPIDQIHVLDHLLQSAEHDDNFLLDLQEAFSTFIKEDIFILPSYHAVVVGPPEEKRWITEKNFSDFQTILRVQNRKEVPEPPPENESAIARKMRLKREMREAVKRKQQQKQGTEQDLAELLEIAETFGIDYMDKSVYAFYGLVQRNRRKEKWEQDLAMLCAGADPKKMKIEYWGDNSKEN